MLILDKSKISYKYFNYMNFSLDIWCLKTPFGVSAVAARNQKRPGSWSWSPTRRWKRRWDWTWGKGAVIWMNDADEHAPGDEIGLNWDGVEHSVDLHPWPGTRWPTPQCRADVSIASSTIAGGISSWTAQTRIMTSQGGWWFGWKLLTWWWKYLVQGFVRQRVVFEISTCKRVSISRWGIKQ